MKTNIEPDAALPSKSDSEKIANRKLLMSKTDLVNFLKENNIRGWPTTNWDNNPSFHSNFLKFWEGNFIGPNQKKSKSENPSS